MNFDDIIDRRGTNSLKWDAMQKMLGVAPDDGLAMWVADMDFAAPACVQDALRALVDQANYGYFTGLDSYLDAVRWWLDTRHGWAPETDQIQTVNGLGNGIAVTLEALSDPGDHVAIFSPVYHEFANRVVQSGRKVTELPLAQRDGVFAMDLEQAATRLTGRERALLFCSPHNPAGRVWRPDELNALADFCLRHDMLLISDEIHQDLVFPGAKHVPMAVAAPQILDRLVVMNAASKTFNLAGGRTGCVIVPNPDLRQRVKTRIGALSLQPNLFGVAMTRAAYSPDGAAWVDALCTYLAGNAALFSDGIDQIPGLSAMPMQATYLAWVDFSGTGMTPREFSRRVYTDARIAATPGAPLGTGGENGLRFNLGMPRARIQEALERLTEAFSDLQ